jgi:4-amino-4-deoxy-L-arabinose transferase-like glycosyltransferase
MNTPLPRRINLIFIPIFLYLCLALPKINQPVTDDEWFEIANAEAILNSTHIRLHVPPLYDSILACCIKIAGPSEAVLRIPGLISAIAAIALLYMLALRIFPDRKHGSLLLIAPILLAINPAFVQGSLLVHIDNTILIPLILAWLLAWDSYLTTGRRSQLIAAILFLGISLLAKYSTPILILFALSCWTVVKDRKRIGKYLILGIGGIALFLFLWLVLSRMLNLDYFGSFKYVFSRVKTYAEMDRFRMILANVITLSLWMSPGIILSLALIIKRERDGVGLWNVPWHICVAGVFLYVCVSSVNHGFPKYYLPAVPFIAALLSAGIDLDRCKQYLRNRRVLIFCAVTTGSVYLLDPVYLYRFGLRQALATGIMPTSLKGEIGICLLLVVVAVVCILVIMRKERSLSAATEFVLFWVVAWSLGQSLCQATAPYQTNYSYGERGTRQLEKVLARLIDEHDNCRIIAINDITWRLGLDDQHLELTYWFDPEGIASDLLDDRTQAIAISIPSHPIRNYRLVMDDEAISVILKENYELRRIGTYYLWTRNSSKDAAL